MGKLTPKQVAILERQMDGGPSAREFLDRAAASCAACGQGTSIFNERKNQIIREATEWFESPADKSDSHVAVRFIAALVEVVKLQSALEYRVDKADKAKATLYAHADQTAG
jgi:superfamily I DNA/RNA helicase